MQYNLLADHLIVSKSRQKARTTNDTAQLVPAPQNLTAIQCANWCWKQYGRIREIEETQKVDNIWAKIQEMGGINSRDQAAMVYNASVSLFQDKNIGAVANNIIIEAYKSFFGARLIECDSETDPDPLSRKRATDCKFIFPNAVIISSVTTIPQERKDSTWVDEQARHWQFYRNKYKSITFLGIFFESKRGATLENNRETAIRKQSLLNGGTVVCVGDASKHAEILKKLLSEVS
jgi:hypothetical protein